MENALDGKIRINGLYDVYGALLTEKQRRTMEYYYQDDYSLSEIAALTGVSRNAVHELLRVAVGHLEAFETALGVVRMKDAAAGIRRRLGERCAADPELARLFDAFEKTE